MKFSRKKCDTHSMHELNGEVGFKQSSVFLATFRLLASLLCPLTYFRSLFCFLFVTLFHNNFSNNLLFHLCCSPDCLCKSFTVTNSKVCSLITNIFRFLSLPVTRFQVVSGRPVRSHTGPQVLAHPSQWLFSLLVNYPAKGTTSPLPSPFPSLPPACWLGLPSYLLDFFVRNRFLRWLERQKHFHSPLNARNEPRFLKCSFSLFIIPDESLPSYCGANQLRLLIGCSPHTDHDSPP